MMISGMPHLESYSRTSTFAHTSALAASPCIVMGNASGQPVHQSIIVRRVFLPSHGGYNGLLKSMLIWLNRLVGAGNRSSGIFVWTRIFAFWQAAHDFCPPCDVFADALPPCSVRLCGVKAALHKTRRTSRTV